MGANLDRTVAKATAVARSSRRYRAVPSPVSAVVDGTTRIESFASWGRCDSRRYGSILDIPY